MGSPFDATAAATRRFGRFELRALLGRSSQGMAWRAHDPRSAQDLVLVLPRSQPAGAAALAEALDEARRASRLQHPHLAHAVEVGEQERWPFIAYDATGNTLAERQPAPNGEAVHAARWVVHCATALAFAHDGGHAHNDVQPWLITVSDSGTARLMGLGLSPTPLPRAADSGAETAEQQLRRGVREAAENDVLALALVLHGLLAGTPALGEPDIGAARLRLAPAGREPIRLPWDVPRPIPDVLRAIANRATDRQVRQRFRNARTLARALEGWLEQESQQEGDAHAQLIERVRQLGVLPALPGAAARVARLAMMERQHTEALAEIVMGDAALTIELLRAVNTAQVRGTQVSGNGPVLTVRRAIAMIGLEGVRRQALAMREWPGPLDATGAAELQATLAAAQRAARLAQALRPAGYDAEMAALVTLLQNLGRLVLQYHQPEEMRQVRRLTSPFRGAGAGRSARHVGAGRRLCGARRRHRQHGASRGALDGPGRRRRRGAAADAPAAAGQSGARGRQRRRGAARAGQRRQRDDRRAGFADSAPARGDRARGQALCADPRHRRTRADGGAACECDDRADREPGRQFGRQPDGIATAGHAGGLRFQCTVAGSP